MIGIGIIIGIVVGGGVGVWLATNALRNRLLAKSQQVLKDAEEKGEMIKKDKILQAKEKFLQLKSEHDKQVNEKNSAIREQEQRLKQREQSLNQKVEDLLRVYVVIGNRTCFIVPEPVCQGFAYAIRLHEGRSLIRDESLQALYRIRRCQNGRRLEELLDVGLCIPQTRHFR